MLGLSRKFIPTERYSMSPDDLDKSFQDLERDCHLKVFFAGDPMDNKPEPLYVKSVWRPPLGSIPQEVDNRLYHFFRRMRNLFKRRRGVSNLLPFQQRLLAWLKQHPSWIIANTDKNLGPCVIELEQYIRDALTHLQNSEIYEFLTEQEAAAEARRLSSEIMDWTVYGRRVKSLSDMEIKYIRKYMGENSEDPHGYFYLMYKVHKDVLSTRPVCSDCASITNPIGKWVDVMLQPIAQSMPTYFKDSFAFKELIDDIVVPIGARVFTSDAVSMYTNIDTNAALSVICPYLRDNETEFGHYHAETLIRALEIVMNNNIIRLGDRYVRQVSGTAMGKPPAPPWATLFEGIHEIEFLPRWQEHLLLYKRFIDDIFAIWIPYTDPTEDEVNWQALQAEVNDNHGLEWVFTERSMSAVFLDMTAKIQLDGSIKTSLYEKPMALYLFIPSHSAHPPGVLHGHICGNVLRIFRLNSDEEDIIQDTLEFFQRFTRRGYNRDVLTPFFLKAIDNARNFLATSKETRAANKARKHEEATRRLYLHIKYHPQNPTAHQIQQLFDETVLHPPGEVPLNELNAGGGFKVPIDAMTIANHRAPNLGDKFSYRDISKRKGPPVSLYL